MAISVSFRAVAEDQPGPQWAAVFARSWPGYRAWFLRSGAVGRPSYLESRRALRQHMPELVPTWERLVALAGGGFGIPLVMRYLLETAHSTAEAIAILQRVPVHMTYSVTLLDRNADWATVFVAPDRTTEVTRRRAVTNFQHQVEWPEHARATASPERLAALAGALERPLDRPLSARQLADILLEPPLYQDAWLRGYGTLYTAVYRPRSGSAELLWPGERWAQSIANFEEGSRDVVYPAHPP